MSVDIRLITPGELDEWRRLMIGVFGYEAKDEDREVFEARMEYDRSSAAYDGSTMVGTTGAFSYRMTVPGGGSVPTAGVTGVTVVPTHRRRGVLTAMMRDQLDDTAERGEPVAALWASESVIYGRFGYGVAILGADAEIDRHHTGLRVESPASGRVRMLSDEEARRIVPPIHLAAGEGVPGWMPRRDADWLDYFYDPEHWRDGASSLRFVTYERDGEPIGYVRYRMKPKWEDAHPQYTLIVGDLQALDGEAYLELFRYAFGVDLVTSFKIWTRRVREPLTSLLVEPRRLRRSLSDQIWLRILDVPAALSARRYSVDGSLVFEVRDDFGGYASGRYRLTGGPEGAECGATSEEPDITLSVADLSASYLGDARFVSRGWAGWIDGDPDALVLANRMFGWHVDPWCTTHF
jgi:predicted acetyltransferase